MHSIDKLASVDSNFILEKSNYTTEERTLLSLRIEWIEKKRKEGGGRRKKEREKKNSANRYRVFRAAQRVGGKYTYPFFSFHPRKPVFSFFFFLQNPYLLALNSSLITLALSRSYLFSYLYLIINLHISGVHPFRDSDIQRVIGLENLFSIETRARSRVRKKEGEREKGEEHLKDRM